MPEKPPVVLTIAGFDPSSGAGVTADIKTIAAHSCYGVACITAVTVQSTSGVRRFEALDSGLVTDTLEELAADLNVAAVHIGMLGSAKVAKAVADSVWNFHRPNPFSCRKQSPVQQHRSSSLFRSFGGCLAGSGRHQGPD